MSVSVRADQSPVQLPAVMMRWLKQCRFVAAVSFASLGLTSTSSLVAQVTNPDESSLRQVRPFTSTPSKPAQQLTTNITPNGKQFPIKKIDPGTLVIRPGEDARVVGANQPVMICREPAALDQRPLAFEDVPLERLGWSTGRVTQPFVSGAKFYGVVPVVVPRGPERHVEAAMGTTEPRYFGAAAPPTPVTVNVAANQQASVIPRLPMRGPTVFQSAPKSMPVVAASSEKRVVPTIRTVAATEPINDLQDALPGFRYVDGSRGNVQPQTDPPRVIAPASPVMVATRPVVEQEPRTIERPVETVQVRQIPAAVETAPVVSERPAPATTPGTVYVWYPTKDGGLVPVARKNPQLVAAQPPAAAPAPVQAPAPAQIAAPVQAPVVAPAPIVVRAPAVVQPPVVVQSPPPAAAPVAYAAAPQRPVYVAGRLPTVDQVVPTEPLPAGAKAPAADTANSPMVIDGRSVIWDQGVPSNDSCIYDGSCCTMGGCHPYAGVEATFFAPQFSNDALTATAFDVANNYTFQSNTSGASYLGAAPRIWAGLGCCEGRGIRFRYWQMDNSSFFTDSLNFANPADTSGYTTTSEFKAYTIDLEATREFCCLNRTFLGSFGVRYAGLSQNETLYAQVLTRPVPDILTAQATSANMFYGTGLTFGLQYIDPLCRNSCCGDWDLFVSGRGSTLFGTNSSKVASSAQVGGAGIYAISNNEALADQEDTLLIGEIQAGVQWTKCMVVCCAPRRFFGRCAVEYQYWGVANGVTTTTSSTAGRAPFDNILISADERNFSGINMIGLTVAAGCYW